MPDRFSSNIVRLGSEYSPTMWCEGFCNNNILSNSHSFFFFLSIGVFRIAYTMEVYKTEGEFKRNKKKKCYPSTCNRKLFSFCVTAYVQNKNMKTVYTILILTSEEIRGRTCCRRVRWAKSCRFVRFNILPLMALTNILSHKTRSEWR